MNTFRIFALGSAAVVAVAAISFAHASDGTMTADQHAALAQELQQKAATASEKAASHEVMARTGSPKGMSGAMARHCERLVAHYRAEAAEYSAQAAEHRHASE